MKYDNQFFDWINSTAQQSARIMVPYIQSLGSFTRILDVGCGQGAWLSVWQEYGIEDVAGLDGEYVDITKLLINKDLFHPHDLKNCWDLKRRFDLVQSLEVAEHLPLSDSRTFIKSLCNHADIILFSAAQPGQGGHNHINEQPPSFWAQIFMEYEYTPYDCIRPSFKTTKKVSPWYRYNTVLYANAQGTKLLSASVTDTSVDDPIKLNTKEDLIWECRKKLLSTLSEPVITKLSRIHYKLATFKRRIGYHSE